MGSTSIGQLIETHDPLETAGIRRIVTPIRIGERTHTEYVTHMHERRAWKTMRGQSLQGEE